MGVNDWDSAPDGLGVTFDSVDAPDTPADKAGLVGGDIITGIDGKPVAHFEDLVSYLSGNTPKKVDARAFKALVKAAVAENGLRAKKR